MKALLKSLQETVAITVTLAYKAFLLVRARLRVIRLTLALLSLIMYPSESPETTKQPWTEKLDAIELFEGDYILFEED